MVKVLEFKDPWVIEFPVVGAKGFFGFTEEPKPRGVCGKDVPVPLAREEWCGIGSVFFVR